MLHCILNQIVSVGQGSLVFYRQLLCCTPPDWQYETELRVISETNIIKNYSITIKGGGLYNVQATQITIEIYDYGQNSLQSTNL